MVVAARLWFEQRSHKIGIMGLELTAELRQLVNPQMQSVSLPLDGLMLSSKLADILGVQPGDRLTVEILESRRPNFTVTVVRLVDEFIGLSAYMAIHEAFPYSR